MKNIKENIKWKIALLTITIIMIIVFGSVIVKRINEKMIIEEDDIINTATEEEHHYIANNEKSNIKIIYPIIHISDIDLKIKNYVDNKLTAFIEETSSLKKSEDKYEFILSSTITPYKDTKIITLKLYIFAGGAHGSNEIKTFAYNTNTKKEITLTDYFNDVDYLNKISTLAYDKVLITINDRKIDPDLNWVKDGTAPYSENYEHYIFTDDGLQITFPTYSVANHAVGEIDILLNYNKINSLLVDKYRNINDEIIDPSIIQQERDITQFKDKKLIMLTFDDGPSEHTSAFIDELNKRNARVTFFVLGSRINQYSQTIKKAYENGNQIGIHMYSHKSLSKLNNNEIIKELTNTQTALQKVIGEEATIVRPPYGVTNFRIKKLLKLPTILWNDDTEDWKYKDSEKIANEIQSKAKNGNIVILHDLYKTSIEGALKAIDKLQQDGYEFVTINEMCELKNITLKQSNVYYYFNK